MAGYFKCLHLSAILVTLFNLQQTTSTTLTDVLIPDLPSAPLAPPLRLRRDIKYPRYATDNSDKTLKPEDTSDREIANSPLGKRCISCAYSSLNKNPYDRNRYYDDYRSTDYDRYDDRDRYYDRDGYYDRYDRPSGRDRYYRGRERYGDRERYGERDRYYDPYDYERSYDPYERNDRYGDRTGDRDRYYDRGVGYDNRGYDYRGPDYRDDSYRSYDDAYRGYSPVRRDYGSSGYANRWNYGNSGGGRDDYYRDRYLGNRPVSKDPVRDPYNETYRPTSYLYGRPTSTTLKPPSSEGSDTQTPSENSG